MNHIPKNDKKGHKKAPCFTEQRAFNLLAALRGSINNRISYEAETGTGINFALEALNFLYLE